MDMEVDRLLMAELLNDDAVQILVHVARVLQGLGDAPGAPAGAAKEAGILVADVSEQLRGLARRLRPSLLDDIGLGPAIRQLTAAFAARSKISVHTDLGNVVGSGGTDLDLVLFRVAQGALDNVAAHSAATEVTLRLRRRGGRLCLLVWDNGSGLSDQTEGLVSGTGFLKMRARLRSVGGTLAVRSGNGIGTVVLASAALPSTRPDLQPGVGSERLFATGGLCPPSSGSPHS
jgi:signal transduction histidine kinase